MTIEAFAGERVISDRRAMQALRSLANQLRLGQYQNAVTGEVGSADRAASEMALGYPVPEDAMGEVDVTALVSAGAADLEAEDATVVPRFGILAIGETLVLLPRDGGHDPGRVYFGRDTLWLAEYSMRFARASGAMADLGTGAGTVAAMLAPSFDVVVATEVLPRTAACAAVTFTLNPRANGTPAALSCLTDVAAGLAPGAFSLVTGNPPWVPSLDPSVYGPPRAYADGGTTGFELPRRFIMEGAMLLDRGGVMVVVTLDVTWRSGERPLRSLARGLGRLGFDVHIEPTGIDETWLGTKLDLSEAFPSMDSAEHVAFVAHRPQRASAVVSHGRGQMCSEGISCIDPLTGSEPQSTNLKSDPKSRWVTSSV